MNLKAAMPLHICVCRAKQKEFVCCCELAILLCLGQPADNTAPAVLKQNKKLPAPNLVQTLFPSPVPTQFSQTTSKQINVPYYSILEGKNFHKLYHVLPR